ncbi:MAG: type IV toxin-antitoxin system AbiEi family antitoxin domain-containing protein [Chloroflexi bacterium]|nr:type IV toxin-antitoxin system AbiEi family antitoxin domain-containing protein [Chloroflexota bacterium]
MNRRVVQELERHGGFVRHRDIREAGIDPHVLARLVNEGKLEKVRRGLYHRADAWLEHTGLGAVTVAAPKGVICLLSALDYYGLTTMTPSEVYLAIPRKARPPRIEYPPVRVVRYGDRIFDYGITYQQLADGQVVRMYSREKTIADAFRFENIVGRDIAIEALKEYLRQPGRDIDALLAAATICRVRPRITAYAEAMV